MSPVKIPSEAEGHAGGVGPLLIVTNRYDGTMTDMYFAAAVAASRLAYHCLFDGPGQGEMLYERGIPLRPDWKSVVRAVVDFAVAQPIVDRPASLSADEVSAGI